MLVVILQAAMSSPHKSTKKTLALTSEILALPTFWFAGPWLTTALFSGIDKTKLLEPYLLPLTCTFMLVSLITVLRLVIWAGSKKEGGGGSDD